MKKWVNVLVDVPEPSEDDLVIDFGDRAVFICMILLSVLMFSLGGMIL